MSLDIDYKINPEIISDWYDPADLLRPGKISHPMKLSPITNKMGSVNEYIKSVGELAEKYNLYIYFLEAKNNTKNAQFYRILYVDNSLDNKKDLLEKAMILYSLSGWRVSKIIEPIINNYFRT